LDWRKRIAEVDPSLNNKLMLAAAGVRYQAPPFPLTTQVLEELSATASNSVPFHLVSAEMALKLKCPELAESHIAAVASLQPTNSLYQLNLAVLRLQSTNAALAQAARTTLDQLRQNPDLALVALRSLVADGLRRGELTAARNYSDQLLVDARATPEDQLQHLSLLKQSQSPDLTSTLLSLQRASATNGPAIYGIATWMVGNGFVDDAFTWLQALPAAGRAQQPVLLALTDCYVAKADWAALDAFLEPQKWGELDFLRFAFRSRAAQQQNQPLGAASNWRSAVTQAGDRLGALSSLLQMAERWNRPADRENLLWRIVGRFPGQRWALHELERNYGTAGNTGGLNKVYEALFALNPNDPGLKNNLAATSLLLKLNQTRAYSQARELYESANTNAVFVSTYAFALHLQGKSADGLKLMQALPEAELQRPEIATYYAVLLCATGARDQAAAYFIAAEKAQLLPEERQLLAQARAQN
jgi:predicted Zn-dependent protease